MRDPAPATVGGSECASSSQARRRQCSRSASRSGAVFAGKGDPSHGNKNGNENKKDRGCPSDYSFTDEMGLEYDLNGDGWVCYKVTGDEYSFIDNITNTD